MRKIEVTDNEYNKLIKRLEFFGTTRNNLLSFSFTAVLTALGVALATDMNTINSLICLMPFLLIIPFTARISYYRLASAHINSFLKEFKNSDMQFESGTGTVKEDICEHYDAIAWLVNHEMVLLSLATSFVFYLKYILSIKEWNFYHYFGLVAPVILTYLVYVIADSTYNYSKLSSNFSNKWKKYKEDDMNCK